MSINKVILVGNVGKDPAIRYFDKGVAKATFPLATSETYTNQQGETITSTEWHNIVLWRALAEVAEKTVKKGSQVYIIGKIKTRSYVDKDGVNKYITEILADTLLLLEENAYDIPGFVPEYIRPLFCRGMGPFRWVALSGDPQDIFTTDQALLSSFLRMMD